MDVRARAVHYINMSDGVSLRAPLAGRRRAAAPHTNRGGSVLADKSYQTVSTARHLSFEVEHKRLVQGLKLPLPR